MHSYQRAKKEKEEEEGKETKERKRDEKSGAIVESRIRKGVYE